MRKKNKREGRKRQVQEIQAVILYDYAAHHHFAFLISYSSEAFKRNQRTARPLG